MEPNNLQFINLSQESAMESHQPGKRGAMAEDRLTGLPDDLLQSILRGLPLKHAVRTSVLSRKWGRQWTRALASSPVLDFADREFARRQPPARAAATVDRCLRLHVECGTPLDVFRVALMSPLGGDGAFGRHVVGWVAAAVARGAREVEVDLTPAQGDGVPDGDSQSAFLELPGDLFLAKNSLERLALGRFGLRAVLPGAAGLAGLRSLSLSHADVTDETVQAVVSSCRALEFLSLRSCHLLTSVMIAGENLRVLELVGCLAVRELHVAAPALESFAFHGDILYLSDPDDDAVAVHFDATPALRDAYVSHLGFGDYDEERHEFAYCTFLSCVAHATILTICTVGLQHIDPTRGFAVTMDVPNLQELQLLLPASPVEDVVYLVSAFFEFTQPPILDRLFIRLLGEPADGSSGAGSALTAGEVDADIVTNIPIVLDHLTLVKVVNFRGTRCELRLLRFLMNRAPALGQLVLVTVDEEGTLGDEKVKTIEMRVSAMRTASPEARVTVCRPSQGDSRNPTHTRFYHEE